VPVVDGGESPRPLERRRDHVGVRTRVHSVMFADRAARFAARPVGEDENGGRPAALRWVMLCPSPTGNT
jgi:hypothetical protein